MGKSIANKGKGEALTDYLMCEHQTGPTKVGYTNKAYLSDALNTTVSVFVNGNQVILKDSTVPSTGCAGSAPPPNMPCRIEGASNTVFAEGRGVARAGDKSNHDNNNASGKISEGSDNVFAGD